MQGSGALIALGGAIMTALVTIQVRDLGRTESALTIVFWFSLISLIPLDDRHMHIDASEVLSALRRGRGEWESDVPEVVARRIVERKLMGFDSE